MLNCSEVSIIYTLKGHYVLLTSYLQITDTFVHITAYFYLKGHSSFKVKASKNK